MNPWILIMLFFAVDAVTKTAPQPAESTQTPTKVYETTHTDAGETKPPCDWQGIAKAATILSIAGAAIGGNLSADYGTVIGGVAGAVGGGRWCLLCGRLLKGKIHE